MNSDRPNERPTKHAIYLSAFLPGLGQFHQRRWLAGLLFLGLFLACFLGVVILVFRYLFGNLQIALDSAAGDMSGSFLASPLAPIVVYLVLALLVYVMSICDAMMAYIRGYRSWARQRLLEKFLESCVIAVLLFRMPGATRADEDPAVVLEAGEKAIPADHADDAPAAVDANIVANQLHRAIRDNAILRVDEILERYGSEAARLSVEHGVTPLHIAAALDDDVTLAILLAHGANISARTAGGFTPLHWAAGRDALRTTRILIAIGADIDTRTPGGVTPAHWAADKNATNVLRLLILSGADIGAETTKGLTPLHWAVRRNSLEAGQMIAFKRVLEERVRRPQSKSSFAVTQEFQIAIAPEPVSAPPASSPQVLPRAEFGRSLVVPIGRGQSMEFAWVESMTLWVGKYEVTNGQFRRFRYKHRSMFREEFSLDGDDQPVVYVSWKDANEFCRWLNKNHSVRLPPDCEFRLPTDKEWTTFAACGTDRKYPWGNSWPPKYGNFSDTTARKNLPRWQGIKHYDDGHIVTCSVTESGANEWGIHGLAGNVWEWCEDWYGGGRKYKVRRGGSWDFDPVESLLLTARGFDRASARYDTIGFRVVVSKK